jgi:hypothetical protein
MNLKAGRLVSSGRVLAVVVVAAAGTLGCATQYKAQPMSFKLPESFPNQQEVAGISVAAEAYAEKNIARDAFGFDARGAGLLPVQVVFDHHGDKPVKINPEQSFLEDTEGNLWPVLEDRFAYERVTKYVETNEIFREGAYRGAIGAVAGAVVGAAVGVVTGENVGEAAGKGAAVGAGAGAVLGGVKGGTSDADEARAVVMDDFDAKSLKNRAVGPGDLAYGFLFFPGEAPSARRLRLQLIEEGTERPYTLTFLLG